MRILHTADWHLGQRFNGYDRHDEHQCFLDWLLYMIDEQSVDALVVAGDIFDTANPNPTAQKQYYGFLAKLSKSRCCKDVVIVGGNHDNPALLNAPGAILKALNIHVIGAAPTEAQEQCIALPTGGAEVQLVIAAVPYLRDADIRRSALGESGEETEQRVHRGVTEHYSAVAGCIRHYREQGVPVMVTGHLFAQGGSLSGSERSRPETIGLLGQIPISCFGDAFDYVALGHLHRHQLVDGHEHIRYSGSPIPLSFAEVEYGHQVLLLDFKGAHNPAVTPLMVPCTRKLLRLSGSLDDVVKELRAWTNTDFTYPAWAEVMVKGEVSPIRVNDALDSLNEELQQKVVVVSRRMQGIAALVNDADAESVVPAGDLLNDPKNIFCRLLDARGYPADGEARKNMMSTFVELLTLEDILEAA